MYIISCSDYDENYDDDDGGENDDDDDDDGTERTLAMSGRATYKERSSFLKLFTQGGCISSAELHREHLLFISASLACQFRYL